MSTDSIQTWHKLARPKPSTADFNVQLGCHFEEIAEMLESLKGVDDSFDMLLQNTYSHISMVATALKKHTGTANITNRKELLDAIADQVVTGIGVAHCAYMDGDLAVKRVDISNWSKFVDGQPVFNEHGKIAKPPTYKEPDLTGCY